MIEISFIYRSKLTHVSMKKLILLREKTVHEKMNGEKDCVNYADLG